MLFFRNYFFTFIPNLSCVYSLEFGFMDQFYLQQNQIIFDEGNRKNKKNTDISVFESPHDKTNKIACAPSEDSD